VVAELFKFKGKMSAILRWKSLQTTTWRGKCTHGRHQQFLMDNSDDNTVCQFSYGGFNGAVHLLIEFVVVELFKFKGKMSALKIRCRSPAGGGKMHR